MTVYYFVISLCSFLLFHFIILFIHFILFLFYFFISVHSFFPSSLLLLGWLRCWCRCRCLRPAGRWKGPRRSTWRPEPAPRCRSRHLRSRARVDRHADLDGHQLSPEVRSALYVNLLTEDNLPYYFRTVESMFGADGPWGTWVRRWTAEEGRHSMAIYGYLMTTRAIDPVELERSRMAQVSGGETPDPPLHEGFIYLALQELATRISHRNTGALLGDPVGYEVMKRVGSGENLHQLFYRDLAAAAFEVDPNVMMIALEKRKKASDLKA